MKTQCAFPSLSHYRLRDVCFFSLNFSPSFSPSFMRDIEQVYLRHRLPIGSPLLASVTSNRRTSRCLVDDNYRSPGATQDDPGSRFHEGKRDRNVNAVGNAVKTERSIDSLFPIFPLRRSSKRVILDNHRDQKYRTLRWKAHNRDNRGGEKE